MDHAEDHEPRRGWNRADLDEPWGCVDGPWITHTLIENYDQWRHELTSTSPTRPVRRELHRRGDDEDDIHIGDISASAARGRSQPAAPPCFKLGIKMGMAGFPKLFLSSGRSGFTCASWRKARSRGRRIRAHRERP